MFLRQAYHKYRGADTAVVDVKDVELNWSGIATLQGTSGAGKTTLFRLMSGWFGACEESVCVIEPPLDAIRDIRLVGAQSSLLPWYTVKKNCSVQTRGRTESDPHSLLEQLGLAHSVLQKYPQELSLGMYKRVEIAIAVSVRPRLLLLDEFFSSMDDKAKGAVVEVIHSRRDDSMTWVIAHEEELRQHLSPICWSLDLDPETKTVVGLRRE